jgi:mono/diheme cytochrome c family protein
MIIISQWARRTHFTGAALALLLVACNSDSGSTGNPDRPLDPVLVTQGREIFRFDTYGNEVFWTDTARMHEVIATSVSPATALSVGLQVDVDALPPALQDAIRRGQVDLNDPATTIALLKLNSVLGLKGTVASVNGKDSLVRVGITCALCHSRVDNSFAPGIGHRLDGWPGTDLNVGAIIALSPAIPENVKAYMRAWGPGKYDPRLNRDGVNTPIVIPPAYGLRGVDKETYTAEGPVAYWNNYVAVTQMHGQGSFSDPRLGISITADPDLVTSKLPALAEYQLSLAAPTNTSNAAAAERGKAVFRGQARCSSCHLPGEHFTDVNEEKLHSPAETGMDPAYAERTATKLYRTTPLRGLAQHPPYFHDGSAATLDAVVEHYDTVLELHLTAQQKSDLVAYLRQL